MVKKGNKGRDIATSTGSLVKNKTLTIDNPFRQKFQSLSLIANWWDSL